MNNIEEIKDSFDKFIRKQKINEQNDFSKNYNIKF